MVTTTFGTTTSSSPDRWHPHRVQLHRLQPMGRTNLPYGRPWCGVEWPLPRQTLQAGRLRLAGGRCVHRWHIGGAGRRRHIDPQMNTLRTPLLLRSVALMATLLVLSEGRGQDAQLTQFYAAAPHLNPRSPVAPSKTGSPSITATNGLDCPVGSSPTARHTTSSSPRSTAASASSSQQMRRERAHWDPAPSPSSTAMRCPSTTSSPFGRPSTRVEQPRIAELARPCVR